MRDSNNLLVQLGRYLSLAFIVPSCTFVGYVIGYLLDRQFGTTTWTTPLVLVGVVAGFVSLVRALLNAEKRGA